MVCRCCCSAVLTRKYTPARTVGLLERNGRHRHYTGHPIPVLAPQRRELSRAARGCACLQMTGSRFEWGVGILASVLNEVTTQRRRARDVQACWVRERPHPALEVAGSAAGAHGTFISVAESSRQDAPMEWTFCLAERGDRPLLVWAVGFFERSPPPTPRSPVLDPFGGSIRPCSKLAHRRPTTGTGRPRWFLVSLGRL
jgi:hypothetical protein